MKNYVCSSFLALLLVLLSTQIFASDKWIFGTEIQHLSSEVDFFGTDIKFDASMINVYAGYPIVMSEFWRVIPSIGAGIGLKPDNGIQALVFGDIFAEIDLRVGASYRVQSEFEYLLSEKSAIFIAPGFTRYKYIAEQTGFESVSFADWDASISFGYNYNMTAASRLKFTYAHMPDTQILSIAYERSL